MCRLARWNPSRTEGLGEKIRHWWIRLTRLNRRKKRRLSLGGQTNKQHGLICRLWFEKEKKMFSTTRAMLARRLYAACFADVIARKLRKERFTLEKSRKSRKYISGRKEDYVTVRPWKKGRTFIVPGSPGFVAVCGPLPSPRVLWKVKSRVIITFTRKNKKSCHETSIKYRGRPISSPGAHMHDRSTRPRSGDGGKTFVSTTLVTCVLTHL